MTASDDPTQDLKQTIGRALGRVPSGFFILTAGPAGREVAMMASWVQQAAFAPPAVSVAVAKSRPAHERILAARTFALSVVGSGDSPLIKKYARGIAPDEDPFAGVSVRRTPAGAAYLGDALAWLECRVLSSCDFGGDHELFVARVVAGGVLKDGEPFTHTRGNGFHY